jgi:hypothetical protein
VYAPMAFNHKLFKRNHYYLDYTSPALSTEVRTKISDEMEFLLSQMTDIKNLLPLKQNLGCVGQRKMLSKLLNLVYWIHSLGSIVNPCAIHGGA